MKAFLSHSSQDKEFVAAVAKELGRQYCVFDDKSFTSGQEFKEAIEQGLDESSVFVLFASHAALTSLWVKFEVDEAWYRKLSKNLSKSLVYLIDSKVQVDDLPEWLRRALVRRDNSAKVVARDIRNHLDNLLRDRLNPYFVGRSQDAERIEEFLTPIDSSLLPHSIFVTGLPGIGRRSLIRHISPKILNIRKQVEMKVGEGDSINDICVLLADYVEPYSTKSGFQEIVHNIRKLDDKDALLRILRNLRSMIAASEVPIFFDNGGLLNSEGYITEPMLAILRSVDPNDDIYMFFVSSRKPQLAVGSSLPVLHLKPLQENETKRLVSILAKRESIEMSSGDVSELAQYVAGYPPSAYFAIQQAKEYGLELVLRDKARLVQFRTDVFLRHLSLLNINPDEQYLISLLATYSPLPLPVLKNVLRIDLHDLQTIIVKLIDIALIITTEDGYYSIADPVADAAETAFGFPSDDLHKALANELNKFLNNAQIDTSRLALSRVLFMASRFAKDDSIAADTLHFANDVIRLTETLYHARKYTEAIRCGISALDERPESVNARNYLARALIQEERWQEAEKQISELQRYGPLRDVYFLRGFLERKRGNIQEAIDAYKEAERLRWRGPAIIRELALCYYLIGDAEQALRYINIANDRHSDNRYIVDLWAQIATSQRDETTARQALGRLEVMDNPQYYYHRLSRVETAFGNLEAALAAAQKAAASGVSPSFGTISQLMYCETEMGNIQSAKETLTTMDQRFGNTHNDTRTGLRCRLEIACGRFGEALILSERVSNKNTFFYKKIRRDALAGEVKVTALKDVVRSSYNKELAHLDAELANIPAERFMFEEADTPT